MIKCPKCNTDMIVDATIILTSYPPQYTLICPECGHTITRQCSECGENKHLYTFDEVNELQKKISNLPQCTTAGYETDKLVLFCDCGCNEGIVLNKYIERENGKAVCNEIYCDVITEKNWVENIFKQYKNWKSGFILEIEISEEEKNKFEKFMDNYSNPDIEITLEQVEMLNGDFWWLTIYNHKKLSFFKRLEKYSFILEGERK